MKDYIERRAIEFAGYIIANKSTVRDTAKVFGISKSTVHKDIADRLPKINKSLYEEVRKVLDDNKSLRHIRGGMATREKYLKLKVEGYKNKTGLSHYAQTAKKLKTKGL